MILVHGEYMFLLEKLFSESQLAVRFLDWECFMARVKVAIGNGRSVFLKKRVPILYGNFEPGASSY